MTAALDGGQRTALSNLIQKARTLLDTDLASTLEGDFGIHRSDGRIEEVDALSLDASQATVRIDLLDIVAFLRSEGETEPAAVERLIREAAFTHVNRLVALRVAEGLGIMPEAIGNGLSSQGFRDFAEIAPASADEDWERFRLFVRICADELSADVPALFDPRNPLLELEPSTAAFSELIELFEGADETIWSASDALGWSYQFFNSGEERREMRESSAPRNSRELAVRNQFFTPSYVVEFLVHNGLGAHLAASFPALVDELPLLVEIPDPTDDPVDLHEVSALDPAVGSGHFLLGAYDVLEAAWRHAGVEPGDAAPAIVRSLCGIDIDPRASQIAQAAVIFRARRHCRTPLPRPNIVCARSLPTGPETDDLIASLPTQVGRVVKAIADELTMAPELGPLLKIEERLDREVRDVFGTGVIEGTLSEAAKDESDNVVAAVLDALSAIADSTTSTASQRLFVADAQDAVRFVEAMSRRYTVAFTNPPYGLACESSEQYLRSNFADVWTELYAAFVSRCHDLAEITGALTSSTFMVSRRLRVFRQSIAENLSALVDLGPGVLHGATVNTAMWLLKPRATRCHYLDARFVDQKGATVRRAVEGRDLTTIAVDGFVELPGSPFAFHVPQELTALWARGDTLDPAVAHVRTGGSTFDNFRYLRAWWELGDKAAAGWIPYEKGGDYQPYVAITPLRVNWKNDGAELKQYGRSSGRLPQVMQSSSHWFRGGLCYPRISSIGFSARLMPPGEIFGEKSIAVLPVDATHSLLGVLGFLNSTVTSEILTIFGRDRSTENSAVKRLPIDPSWCDDGQLVYTTESLLRSFVKLESSRETSILFDGRVETLALGWAAHEATLVSKMQEALDQQVRSLLGVAGELDGSVARRPDLNASLLQAEVEGMRGPNLVSFLVGVCFGRWKEGGASTNVNADVLDVGLPLVPASLAEEPSAGLDQGLLLDQPGHDLDLASMFEEVARNELTPELAEALNAATGRGGARTHLRKRFFSEHLRQYTRSGRKAPIYWQLQVPSKRWGLWLYMPWLSREMLFAVVRETEQRHRLAEQRISTLEQEYGDGGAGRTISSVSGELDAEQTLAAELVAFRDEAERIANLGWEPDLDDGAVLNAAPLATLFPAWKDAATYRRELKQGKYTWSTVSKYADQL